MHIVVTLLVQDEADIVDALAPLSPRPRCRRHDDQRPSLTTARPRCSTSTRATAPSWSTAERRGLRQGEWVTHVARAVAERGAAGWSRAAPTSSVAALRLVSTRSWQASAALQGRPRVDAPLRPRPATSPLRAHDGVRARPPTLEAASPPGGDRAPRGRGRSRLDGEPRRRGRRAPLLRDRFPFEVFHFPVTGQAAARAKFRRRMTSPDGPPVVHALELSTRVSATSCSPTLARRRSRGTLRDGTLVDDTRLRGALRRLAADGRLPGGPARRSADSANLAEDAHVALGADSAAIAEQRAPTGTRSCHARTQVARVLGRRIRGSTSGGSQRAQLRSCDRLGPCVRIGARPPPDDAPQSRRSRHDHPPGAAHRLSRLRRALARPRPRAHPRLARRQGSLPAGRWIGDRVALPLQPLLTMSSPALIFRKFGDSRPRGCRTRSSRCSTLVPWKFMRGMLA